MVDLSSLSTEDLMRMRASAAPQQPAVDLSGISTEDLMRLKATVARKPDAIERSALEAMKPSGLERLGRGIADVTQGITQGALTLADKISPRQTTMGDLVTGKPVSRADEYTREKSEELARYERGRGPDAGIDLMRIGGNVVGTAPAMLIPGAGAAGMGVRAAAGAAQGATAGASMFTPEGESKLSQTLVGAGFGAVAPVVISGLGRAVNRLMDRSATGTITLPAIQGEIQLQLQQKGLDFNKLTKDVQDSLVADAQKVLQTGGNLNPTQLARKADIESIGAKGTQAAVSRGPKDWQTQQNLRGGPGGEPIMKRAGDDATAMVDYLAKLRATTGGKAATAYEAGEAPIKALQAADTARNKVVDDLYEAYRAQGAQDTAIPATKVADTLGRVADEIGVENIPPAVLSRLKEFGLLGGKQTKLLTINEADKLNKLINNNNPGAGTPGARALQPIKQSLNDALMDVPDTGASQSLLAARKAAADMFAERRASAGVTAAVEDVAPDKFVKKFVLDAPVKDMRATLDKVRQAPGGAQAVSDIKGHLFDSLLMKATGATNADDVAGRAFSGRNFSKALDAIEPEKLHALFTPSEIESLRTLQRASKYLTEEVPFSDVNHSKTAAAMANLFMKIGQTPLLGGLLSPIIGTGKIGMDWVKDAGQRKAVAELLITSAGNAGNAAKTSATKLPPPGDLARLAPAVAGGAAAGASNEKN